MANQKMITAALASSSSSKSPDPYEVFLSFRGVDTRQNFTSHLYEALSQKKIKTFIDNKLKTGDEISPALIKAIEESQASIIIFSKNYASSKWCLEELIKILECKEKRGQLVIPVFYKVEPSHVRWQKGSYKQAFEEHEQNNKEKVQQWKAALTKASHLSGLTWKSESDRTESEFIKNIVGDVLKKLDLRYPIELKGLVGIEESCAEIESLLEIGGSEVWSIGIWGMGGIGKTTLATAVYVKLYSSFEGHCFLANVREESAKINGLNALRNKLFSELLKKENLKFNALGALSKFDMSRLRRTNVFIVLDDVATLEQLEDLILDFRCLGSGSRIIVTSRNNHVCSNANRIYKVNQLSHDDSVKLFCGNAFSEKLPKHGYEVISYCKGNPLALKVLGAHLRGRSEEVCLGELRKLETIPNPKIQNMLKLSYDDLDDTQKKIFLDIACFYKGESLDRVKSLLEAGELSPCSGIPILLDMALITISYDNIIKMHDLIQEMGWEIVRQESTIDPGRRSRLWNPKEVYDVLKYNKGTEVVEGIRLDMSKIGDMYLSSESFAKMTNLRYLDIYNCNPKERYVCLPDGLASLPDKLIYLRWQSYCLKSLPPTFCPKMLVELDMSDSKLEKLWDGVQEFQNLKKINLRGSEHLVEVPDLSMAPNLVQVSLMYCVSLRHIHPSILTRPKLTRLDLAFCDKIEIVSKEYCSSLQQFSATTEALEHLDPMGSGKHEFPQLFLGNNNSKLEFLNLNGCENIDLKRLFDDRRMGSLTELSLSWCEQVNASNLSLVFDCTRSLRHLHLIRCCNLKTLPVNFGLLSSLQKFVLSGTDVGWLPSNIKNLSMLRELYIVGCVELVFVPELPPSIQELYARDCTSLKIIFNLNTVEIVDGLPSLRRLDLSNCFKLQILPDSIGLLSSLEKLYLSGTNVGRLPSDIKNLSMLQTLHISDCRKLVFVPELPPSLQELYALDCTSLEIIFNLNTVEIVDGLPSLRRLDLSNCCKLQILPDSIGLLSSLEKLYLSGTNVERLPSDIKNLSMLRELYIVGCKHVVFVPELPPSLQELYARNCISLEIIFNLNTVEIVDGLPSLRRLDLSNCCNLLILPDSIGLLSSLEKLDLSRTNVQRLPSDIKNLSMLRELYIVGCKDVVFVPELPPSLQEFSASYCTSLKIIFNLNTVEIVDGLPSLRWLDLSNCCNLQILPDSIGLLSSLEKLDLSGTNVERLPSNIKNLSKLRTLKISDCRKQVFVPELPPLLRTEYFSSLQKYNSRPDFEDLRPRNQIQDEKDSFDCFMGEETEESDDNDDDDNLSTSG